MESLLHRKEREPNKTAKTQKNLSSRGAGSYAVQHPLEIITIINN